MVKAGQLAPALTAPFVVAGGLFSSGAALGAFLMIRRALWLQGAGPICGVHATSLHCPGCYVAAVLMLSAIAVAAKQSSARGRT